MSMDRIERWASTLRTEWPFKLRLRAWPIAIGLLFIACIISGLATVAVTHMTRVQYAQLQQLEQEKNQLQTEWGQLLLEEGAWSTPARIEQIATERLDMRIPDVHDVEVIRP
ncbi:MULTISPECIES: cell division protein FtsL [Vreelandella]|uniref:Cell division protein FtsL n=2 Tax=Vreelandella TaxID=3137766 RepID=A0A433KGY1_9GAMM|nr:MULTISPECIES: cell division protein FtsL [Halomonas]RUR28222.1 cell division protein FtsL [Halomonas nanhaiensis]RUR42577.1 cell division protein FtsL [Halomonas populi]RUR45820.1 cell division protein FtsL [Halomonas populi]RUR57124.1 cell division protein FtsL [Halomonas populi]